MILAKEITEWDCEHRQPNHTYLMSDSMSKVYGYFKWHDPKQFEMLRTPLRIDKRYRQFKILQKNIKDIE
jgi:hypothetical protein